jgi:hypothetical protein
MNASVASPAHAESGKSSSRMAVLGVVLIVAAIVLWILMNDDDSGPVPAATPPALMTNAAGFPEIAATIGARVYWAGDLDGRQLEITQTAGDILVRYLPAGVSFGVYKTHYVAILTHPQADAFASVQVDAMKPKASVTKLAHGGLAVTQAARPLTVTLAFPDKPVRVDVTSPTAGEAQQLADSGKIRPVTAQQP